MFRNVTLGACLVLAPLAGSRAAVPPAPVDRRVEGQLVLENIPPTPPALASSLLAYDNTRSAAFADWLADGTMLISTRFGQTAQIHRVAFPGGARQQLTFFDEPVAQAYARPGRPDQYVFGRDTGGGEYYQFYLATLSGDVRPLTPEGTRNLSPVFSSDGALLAWSSVARGQTDYDILMAEPDRPATRRVAYHGAGEINPLVFSPDGKRLLLEHDISAASQKLFLLDIAAGTVKPVDPSADDIAYTLAFGAPHFISRGDSLLLVTNKGSAFKRLIRYDPASGISAALTSDIPWDVEGFDVSRDGRTIAFSVDQDGWSRLYIMPVSGGGPIPVSGIPGGVIEDLKFSPDSTRLAVDLSSATSPLDIWSYTIATHHVERWTTSEIGGLDAAAFVPASLFHFPSFDGRQIPAFLYQPKKRAGKMPVIISIHGGPEAQERPDFYPTYQYWVNTLGATVIAPNVRGSDGYGRLYLALDNGFKRQDSVRDIGALLDWIGRQPDLDPSRVVVAGGSYGGFMTLASFAAYGDRLAGAYDIVGPSNLVTFLEHTEAYRRDLRRVEYGDERDPAMRKFLEDTAPLNNTAKMTKPLLVVAGKNDPRVPYTEGEQLVAKLRAQGADVWYMLANDEGHGFHKKPNRDAERAAETLWLQKVLKP